MHLDLGGIEAALVLDELIVDLEVIVVWLGAKGMGFDVIFELIEDRFEFFCCDVRFLPRLNPQHRSLLNQHLLSNIDNLQRIRYHTHNNEPNRKRENNHSLPIPLLMCNQILQYHLLH